MDFLYQLMYFKYWIVNCCLPVWTLQWSFIWCLNLKAFPQNSHLKGLSPVWTGRCVISDDTSGKLLPQNLHSTTFPGSTGPISRSIGDSSLCICRYVGSLNCPIIGRAIGRPSIASRYFKVSSVCVVSMCRVSLLWWGKAAPQWMQGYPLSPSSIRPLPDPSYSCNHKKEHQLLFSLVPFLQGPNCVQYLYHYVSKLRCSLVIDFFFHYLSKKLTLIFAQKCAGVTREPAANA